MTNTIYALKGAEDRSTETLSSLKRGEGRFGWSYIENADLRKLRDKIEKHGWDNLTEDEQSCYQSFLLEFKPGDYAIYINVPDWGNCTAAEISGEYYWRYDDDDFNHRFPVDPTSIRIFNRNDELVHPALRARLKLQGRWWRIYNLEEQFNELLDKLDKNYTPVKHTRTANLRFLSNEIEPFLLDITRQIHLTHPNYDLESLLVEVFKNVPGVVGAVAQGGAGDYGADILVKFDEGLPIPGLEKRTVLVVQVKSYEGDHSNSGAVDDIKRAFEHYPEATMGLLISTADSINTTVEAELDNLRETSGRPVALLIGSDVAAFLLRYGTKLLE